MKPTDVKSNTYIDFDVENNDNGPKFEVSDHVRISKYQHIFSKVSLQICQKKLL